MSSNIHLEQFSHPEDGGSMSEVTKLTAWCKNPKDDHQLNNSLHENPKIMSWLMLEGDTNGSLTCSSDSGMLRACLPCIYDFDL